MLGLSCMRRLPSFPLNSAMCTGTSAGSGVPSTRTMRFISGAGQRYVLITLSTVMLDPSTSGMVKPTSEPAMPGGGINGRHSVGAASFGMYCAALLFSQC